FGSSGVRPLSFLFRFTNSCLPAVPRRSETRSTEFFGGDMLKKSNSLITATFLCFLMFIFVTPAHSQDPRQGRGGRGQVALPDGPGKEEVQMQCSKCHALGLIVNAGGNTKQEWADLFGTMAKL